MTLENRKRLDTVCRNKILLALLNIDWENEQKVNRFRDDYHLYVLPTLKPSFKELKKEFIPLLEIIKDYLTSGDLEPKQISLINEKLKDKRFEMVKINPNEIKKINYYLDPSLDSYNDEIKIVDKPQFSFVSVHNNAVVVFWEEFAKFIVRGQLIKSCAGCGKFYIPKKRSHNQLFCDPFCQDKYKKRRKSDRKKKSLMSSL